MKIFRLNPDAAKGMTFPELLVSAVILCLVMLVTVSVHTMLIRMFAKSQTEGILFKEGQFTMDMIQRGDRGLYGLMKARSNSIVINADQDRIDFATDQNAEYTDTTADDVAMAMYFDNGDGNDGTLEDNSVFVQSGADVYSVGQNVESVVFTQNGDVVTVDLTVADTVRGETMRLAMSRDIRMRN